MTLSDGIDRTDNDNAAPLMSGFLAIEEVLGYLNVTPRTIYRLIRIGDLPAVRIGRQWRIRRADLDLWLGRQRTREERP